MKAFAITISLLMGTLSLGAMPFARARSQDRIWMNGGVNYSGWINIPGVVQAMQKIPGLVHQRRVRFAQGWNIDPIFMKLHPNLEAIYEKDAFRAVQYKIESEIAKAYDNLLMPDEIAEALATYHVRVPEQYLGYLPTTTYILSDANVRDGVLAFVVSSVCTRNSQFVPTSSALVTGILAIPRCPAGRVYSVIKIAHVYYNPACVDPSWGVETYCSTPDQVKKPVWSKTKYIGVNRDEE